VSETKAPAPPTGGAYLRVIAVAAAIGIPAALGADAPPWYLVVGLPVVGACIALAARTLLPGDGGRPPLEGLGAIAVAEQALAMDDAWEGFAFYLEETCRLQAADRGLNDAMGMSMTPAAGAARP
jgi:hypothetical protein